MAMFKEAADIKTSDQLHLPVPDAKFETVVVKPSEIQQDMVQALSERAAEVHSGSVDPSVDNMLKITSDGRKIGLDQRLMNSALPDDPNSKLNACVNNVLRIWNDTKEQKLTQLIFCDMSTPKGDGSFNVYNHVIFNSTALDGTRKFRDFFFSALAVQRLSDLICLEHQLSVIEIKPYLERQKRTLYPPKESNRDRLCGIIDSILAEKPKDYEDFLQKLEQQGYEVKRGKYTSVKGARQKRFIRFKTLGAGYSEDELKAVIAGKAEHHPHQKQPPQEQPFQLLVNIQAKLSEGKSEGYARWAKKYNLKEMSKTLIFLQEHKIGSADELNERTAAATEKYHQLGDSIKAAETRMAEIAVLKTHIVNYAKTHPVYDAYRKAGYSQKFLDTHREEITLHKAAKAAFDETGLKKLPKVKALNAEYSDLLTQKKAAYPDYRKAREEMQEFVKAQKNIELFFAEEKDAQEKQKTR